MDSKTRRLSDKIIAAHTQACRENKIDVADLLLQALEIDLSAIGGEMSDHRLSTELLESAFENHEKAHSRS